jgi:LPS-assembly protein
LDHPLFDTSPLTFDYNQLFQPRRFVGHDRLEDFNQVATGITSRLIEDETGRELGHASIGQIFYFEDRRVNALTTESTDNQPNSAVAGQVALQPTTSLWVSSNILWDQSSNEIEQGNIYAHYEPAAGAIYNIGYRYNQPDPAVSTLADGLRQADFSAAIPLNLRWRAFMRVNYDFALRTTLEDMVGLEYEDCCWVTRLVYQRAIFAQNSTTGVITQAERERDEAILFEFQLKGLGGLGRKVGTLLDESIWGYRDRY